MSCFPSNEAPTASVELGDLEVRAKIPVLEVRPGESETAYRTRSAHVGQAMQAAISRIIAAANAGDTIAVQCRPRGSSKSEWTSIRDTRGTAWADTRPGRPVTVNYYAAENRAFDAEAELQAALAPSASIRKILDGVEDAHAADPDRHLFDVIQTTTRRVAAADNRRRKRAEVQYGTVTEWAKSGHLRVVPEDPTEAPADMSFLSGYLPVIGDRVTYVADVILGKAPATENEHRA